jgi:hypothetical protein
MQTPEEYAAIVPKKNRCLTCALGPEVLEHVHRAHEAGVTINNLAGWLRDVVGVTIPPSTLKNHFALGHRRRFL